MAVNLKIPDETKIFPVKGIEIGIAKAGIKEKNRRDLTIFRFSKNTNVAGIFTKNHFRAPPVKICEKHLASGKNISGLVINTGIANAGTGKEGLKKAIKTCNNLGKILNVPSNQILPFSTGIVLEPLPIERLLNGLPVAVNNLNKNNWLNAAHAIMTTDTLPKITSNKTYISGKEITFTGISKGSGMISPNMATMLSFIGTDVKISKNILQKLTIDIANKSFNRITVDGDTSTNDSFILIATGQSGINIESQDSENYIHIRDNLINIATDLAKKIVRDGEGATKFITIIVEKANSVRDALKIAYSIAKSPLVKTAFYSSDLNLGRVLVAIGFANVSNLNIHTINIWLNDIKVITNGNRDDFYQKDILQKIMMGSEINLRISLDMGNICEKIYTCDMSHDYISINSAYRS
ncbi:MAG: bifunctional glutamate N-acetyltransferase/amino-acid acetyltransferase ArgJ [Bordetella sp.]|nr:MAG: bifunctional glutamate N-acetyltransferase/amino-acid acetyltransferase ArgJ [Bordetella sp.]